MNIHNKLRKNLLILLILNISLLIFAILYTLYFKANQDPENGVSCVVKKLFSIYCPGCGGSRSLYSFLSFDFLNSFILYPPIIISAGVILDYDRRLILTLIKKDTAITDNFKFYTFIIIPASIILWFIIRNILLLVFKIDTVGDFIP